MHRRLQRPFLFKHLFSQGKDGSHVLPTFPISRAEQSQPSLVIYKTAGSSFLSPTPFQDCPPTPARPLATYTNGIPPGDNALPPHGGSNQHPDFRVVPWESERDALGSLSASHKAFLHFGRHNCLTCHPGWGPRKTGVASSVGGC